jgi:hypothetical protein
MNNEVFEKWQPDPRVITAVKTSVENVEAVRTWLSDIYGSPANESVTYMKGNEIVIDWHIKYRDSFSIRVGDYLVHHGEQDVRVYDRNEFSKEYTRVTSAVSLESEAGKCNACGQDVMYFMGQVWHIYAARLCPGIMRSVPASDIYIPTSKEQNNG